MKNDMKAWSLPKIEDLLPSFHVFISFSIIGKIESDRKRKKGEKREEYVVAGFFIFYFFKVIKMGNFLFILQY